MTSPSLSPALSVAVLGDVRPWQAACAGQAWQTWAAAADDAALLQASERSVDLVLWAAPEVAAPEVDALQTLQRSVVLAGLAADLPVLVLVSAIDDASLVRLLHIGADDVLVLPPDRQDVAATLARAVRVCVTRKRMAVLQRKGGSIDVGTGLPSRTQWLDHLSQLCALREREPAPMAVLVLRTLGHEQVERHLGPEAWGLVQRKLAVRLRAALRASDVVGAVAPQTYAVLLSWMESPKDADLVAAKLRRSLEAPVRVGTEQVVLKVSTGIAHHGADGKEAADLLRAALARAGQAVQGEAGVPAGVPTGLVDGGRGAAANDPSPDPAT